MRTLSDFDFLTSLFIMRRYGIDRDQQGRTATMQAEWLDLKVGLAVVPVDHSCSISETIWSSCRKLDVSSTRRSFWDLLTLAEPISTDSRWTTGWPASSELLYPLAPRTWQQLPGVFFQVHLPIEQHWGCINQLAPGFLLDRRPTRRNDVQPLRQAHTERWCPDHPALLRWTSYEHYATLGHRNP